MAGNQFCVSVVPQAIDALVALAREDLGDLASTYDGEGASDDPGDFLMIGVEDPDSEAMSLSAETDQDWASIGAASNAFQEEGTITCAAVAWTGDSGQTAQKIARDKAYAIIAALSKATSADATLGLGPWFVGRVIGHQNLSQMTHDQGVTALVVFQFRFAARLYPPT